MRQPKNRDAFLQKFSKPKTYWCPELSLLRDRKRFWWTIWISCDRPRSGIVFIILKDHKRQFRKLSHSNINNLAQKETNIINTQFRNRNLNTLWNKLKVNKKLKVRSKLNAEDFQTHFSSLTSDNKCLSVDQEGIQNAVKERALFLARSDSKPFKCTECDYCECVGCSVVPLDLRCIGCRNKEKVDLHVNNITKNNILEAIKSLKKGIYAMSPRLVDLLVNIYSIILTSAIVPDIFQKCLIVPILKKATLDSNDPTNYRPIALSSVHTKLIEYIIMPRRQSKQTAVWLQKRKGNSFCNISIK